MEYTKEELEKKFNSVPENIQGLILDENFGPAITLLCKELGVDAVKALDVEDETLHVLIGISDPKDFIHNIQTKIGVDEEKARAIAEKVNDEIFQLVKESLKVVHNIGDDQQPTTSSIKVGAWLYPNASCGSKATRTSSSFRSFNSFVSFTKHRLASVPTDDCTETIGEPTTDDQQPTTSSGSAEVFTKYLRTKTPRRL